MSGPSFDRYVDAMLLLEDGHLAVGSFETVFLFEADSLRHAMLECMHNVAANASLATTSGLGSMSLLEGGHLAVGTAESVLLFKSASLSRAVLELKQNVSADASLSADVASFSLVLLEGGHLTAATRCGVNLYDSASISRALHESQHDVQPTLHCEVLTASCSCWRAGTSLCALSLAVSNFTNPRASPARCESIFGMLLRMQL